MWRPRSLRLRYTLRALLVFITLFMLWGGYHANRSWHEHRCERILLRGGLATLGRETGSDELWIVRQYRALVRALWKERYITSVSINADLTNEEAEAIASLPHLRSLWLRPRRFSVAERRELKEFFRPTQVTSSALQTILSRQALIGLDVSGCNLQREDYVAVGQNMSIQCLRLNSTNVTDEDVTALLSLPNLREIGLARTRVTGSGLESIPGSMTLVAINCDGTPAGRQIAAFAAKCPHLTILSATHESVDDAFVRELEGHPNLVNLSIGSAVTDDIVESIKTIPNLEWLQVRGATLSPEAKSRLKDAVLHVGINGVAL